MGRGVGRHHIPETHLVYHTQDVTEADAPIVMRVRLNSPRFVDRFEEVERPLGRRNCKGPIVRVGRS
jgi:hypothetical protein